MMPADYRIGIDVGGTFTDFVLLDPASGRLVHHKEPSTPHDPSAAVESGIAALLARAGAVASSVGRIAHGTTIGLNAILQRRGARVGVVTAEGNGDLLEIGRVRMSDPYGFFALPETPLARRDHVFEIPARVGSNGAVERTPDAADYDRVAASLLVAEVDAVCVVILNAYLNPAFEESVADGLAARMAGTPVAASTSIWSEAREYERGVVAVMNAFIAPLMHRYYQRLEQHFTAGGFVAPISITTSNGGAIDLDTAYRRPVDSILSGPASGVVAAIDAARRAGIANIVTFDMGGTSADIAIADGAAPEITTQTMLGETPLMLPVVNVGAIGAGGGSIVQVGADGVLKVGPASAGADPGPACYGRGGVRATITDCYLLLGLLDADNFLEGRLRLSVAAARAALAPLAARLGYDGVDAPERAADAALRVASSMMATEVRKSLARRGADPAAFTLVPYGGAGPTHAALLAAEAGIDSILVAPSPGTFCALGAAVSNLRRDYVQSVRLTLDCVPSPAQEDRLRRLVERSLAEARDWMAGTASRVERWQLDISADLHYPLQAFDLTVTARDFNGTDALGAALLALFHEAHQSIYAFSDPSSPVELGRIVLSAVGVLPHAEIHRAAAALPKAQSRRRVRLNGVSSDFRVVQRTDPALSGGFAEPLIVEQADTTIVVPPGWRTATTASGSLLLTKIAEG
jgi:N-methylhydantoinase A